MGCRDSWHAIVNAAVRPESTQHLHWGRMLPTLELQCIVPHQRPFGKSRVQQLYRAAVDATDAHKHWQQQQAPAAHPVAHLPSRVTPSAPGGSVVLCSVGVGCCSSVVLSATDGSSTDALIMFSVKAAASQLISTSLRPAARSYVPLCHTVTATTGADAACCNRPAS